MWDQHRLPLTKLTYHCCWVPNLPASLLQYQVNYWTLSILEVPESYGTLDMDLLSILIMLLPPLTVLWTVMSSDITLLLSSDLTSYKWSKMMGHTHGIFWRYATIQQQLALQNSLSIVPVWHQMKVIVLWCWNAVFAYDVQVLTHRMQKVPWTSDCIWRSYPQVKYVVSIQEMGVALSLLYF